MDIYVNDFDVLYENESYTVTEHHDNLFDSTGCDFSFDSLDKRHLEDLPCLTAKIEKGKKYRIQLKVHFVVEERGNVKQADFNLRNSAVWVENGIARKLNPAVGEFDLNINHVVTSKQNLNYNTKTVIVDVTYIKGHGTVYDAKLYEEK